VQGKRGEQELFGTRTGLRGREEFNVRFADAGFSFELRRKQTTGRNGKSRAKVSMKSQ